MGGKGSGGLRVGAGRKSKQGPLKILQGSATRRDRTAPSAKPVQFDHFDAPDDLSTDERLVWLRLAPHAFAAGTLAPAMEYQFVMLCRNIVLERQIALDPDQRGGANHRGIIQRIDAELARFCLAPMGKPIAVATPEDDPFAEFEAGGSVQ